VNQDYCRDRPFLFGKSEDTRKKPGIGPDGHLHLFEPIPIHVRGKVVWRRFSGPEKEPGYLEGVGQHHLKNQRLVLESGGEIHGVVFPRSETIPASSD